MIVDGALGKGRLQSLVERIRSAFWRGVPTPERVLRAIPPCDDGSPDALDALCMASEAELGMHLDEADALWEFLGDTNGDYLMDLMDREKYDDGNIREYFSDLFDEPLSQKLADNIWFALVTKPLKEEAKRRKSWFPEPPSAAEQVQCEMLEWSYGWRAGREVWLLFRVYDDGILETWYMAPDADAFVLGRRDGLPKDGEDEWLTERGFVPEK